VKYQKEIFWDLENLTFEYLPSAQRKGRVSKDVPVRVDGIWKLMKEPTIGKKQIESFSTSSQSLGLPSILHNPIRLDLITR